MWGPCGCRGWLNIDKDERKYMDVKLRFQSNQNIMSHAFADVFLVRCPRCQCCAQVIPDAGKLKYTLGPYCKKNIRFICTHCGFNKKMVSPTDYTRCRVKVAHSDIWQPGFVTIGGSFDWYFGFPLYLQTACCGKTLWAFNLAHLLYLEEYVQAELREDGPTYYLSIIGRLPQWIISAKNRKEVLRCMGKLKSSLTGSSQRRRALVMGQAHRQTTQGEEMQRLDEGQSIDV